MGTALVLGFVGGALFFIAGKGIAKLFKMTSKSDAKESDQGIPRKEELFS
ncbi:MAG: hypothetical protein KH112_08825 [Sanguibacteroides justesenii]|nr:hypothetical protein [Sanguibacteroides justesenii]